jgi:hypothetical protein
MCYKFIALNFAIGFLADLILNFLSRISFSPKSIQALYPYFVHYNSAFLTAVYAGMTILIVLLVTMLLSFSFLRFAEPRSLKQLTKFLILAFPLGYLADVLIYHWQIFGSHLDPFYEILGAGFGGALSFLFSIVVSYFLLSCFSR